MKKKFISLMILSLALVTGITGAIGCGSKSSSANGGKKDKITIRFATWDTDTLLKIEQDIAKKFEEKHPDIKVQVEAYGDGFDQKVAASFGAKNPPDVLYMWDFPTYNKSLLPLTDFISNDKEINMDDFYPGLLNYSKVNGVIYGMPAGFTTHVVYYNKKMFDEAKVPYPQEGWTWDDFKQISAKLSKPDQKQYGFAFSAEPDPNDFEQYLWCNGTSYVSPDGSKFEGYANSKEAVDTIQMFIDMAKNKQALLIGPKASQGAKSIFKTGKLAMYESGIWPMTDFKDAKIDFGVVGLPAFSGKKAQSMVNSSSMCIAKDSKYKDAAWEFVKFYVSSEAIKMRTSDLPVRKSVVKELNTDKDPLIKPFYTMLENADRTPSFLLAPQWNKSQQAISDGINLSFNKLGDVKSNLDKAVKEAEKQAKK